MNITELEQWYYLIYLLPGGISLLILMLSTLGGGHHHRIGSHHAHGRLHLGSHSGTAKAVGHSHHSTHQTRTAHSHPQTGQADRSLGSSLMAFFGLGRVPSPFIWGSALLGWGMFGFWGTQLLQSHLHLPALFVLPALGIALAGAVLTEKITAEAVLRLLPMDISFVTRTVDLCGLTGTVAFPVDEARGRVHVYDTHGTLHDVRARVEPGHRLIERGWKVLVMDYDVVHDQLIVEEALS